MFMHFDTILFLAIYPTEVHVQTQSRLYVSLLFEIIMVIKNRMQPKIIHPAYIID